MTWFAPSGRMRGWSAALVLMAVSGFLLQPACDAWWTRGDRADVAGVVAVQSHRTVQAGAHRHSGADECCVIEAVADHVSPLPSVTIRHDRSPDAGMVLTGAGHSGTLGASGVSSGAAYRPPDRGTPYHARSARLLL